MIENIKAILLYGSVARGDSDLDSDVDVLVIVNELPGPPATLVRTLAPALPRSNLSISCYSHEQFVAMACCGSLFAWHIKAESTILYGTRYVESTLERLVPFTQHRDELAEYSHLLDDLQYKPCGAIIPNEFDLALIFTIVRNTCVVLSHFCGEMAFGRTSCFEAAVARIPKLPFDRSVYLRLSEWKLSYERGVVRPTDLPDSHGMKKLVVQTHKLLKFADKYVNDHQ